MRILMTANSMWNIWNFRKDLVIWLISKNYEVYILKHQKTRACII